jgi:hypothetical protein
MGVIGRVNQGRRFVCDYFAAEKKQQQQTAQSGHADADEQANVYPERRLSPQE